jgi:thiol-disulfide isomerase/thioredoxin
MNPIRMKSMHGLAAALALILAACRPASTDDAEPRPASAETPAAETAPATEATPDTAPDAAAENPEPEHPALRIATLDGAQYELAAKRGRWVVVNFWATWCKPCIKEMPELDAFDATREDVEVLGLAYEDIEPADMRAFLAKRPVKYPIAIVDTYDPPADFPTPRGLPMTYLIAPDGRIAKRFLGPITGKDLADAISAATTAAPAAATPSPGNT